ncbi:phosphotransferase family protein [Arenicella sp. 4NH20-0111]|uniref:phosphotransferase family protein n=1 Tax=Arenicella sp. 4NH20-0111 TaxID=3127648 RepID=UPI003107BD0B
MNDATLDKAGKVRPGEELELSVLNPWLKERVAGISGDPEVTQYSGGASNWTYCLSYPEKEVVLRRAPAGTKAKGAHDMGREHRLQDALKPVYPYVPSMLAHSDDDSIIGTEFYVMEKINGLIPRTNMPKGLQLDETQVRQLCTNAIDSLINLHQVDYQAADLSHIAKGEGYTKRQIDGWNHRYTKAKTWNVPGGKKIMSWLSDNMPGTEAICLTHNDFRLDNLVLDTQDPTKIIGVLDWELATLGDPLMDLGNSLAYWVESGDDRFAQSTRRQPTHLKGMMTRQEVIDYYLEKTGFEVRDFRFYEVYGLFRLAGIVQQIYYRYHHKQTRNKSFKNLWVFVHYLLYRCNKVIKRGA